MKTSFAEIDKIFHFKGIWDIPSKCGLKILNKNDNYTIIVSELYKDNPGTSVTQAVCSLAKQICNEFTIPQDKITYIEHNPGMNSKLSFYDEEFFLVNFEYSNNNFVNPIYTEISGDDVKRYYK
ncbi:MAG: hypothetical protein LBV69_01535 [Bacteroidales bacterium]|jgi:hypothetical protein|nr:hypothetical protein [Bacteroidales bacterium]